MTTAAEAAAVAAVDALDLPRALDLDLEIVFSQKARKRSTAIKARAARPSSPPTSATLRMTANTPAAAPAAEVKKEEVELESSDDDLSSDEEIVELESDLSDSEEDDSDDE